jgi:alkylation response protein AidB-like acyl-CoA dehydrogenase
VNALRTEVRTVVAAAGIAPYEQCDAWMRGHDPAFTTRLAEAGLIGLTWPAELGGRGAGAVDRLVVTEELLRVGAPVAAHWIADRQIGPAILRHGSPELQQAILPRIASGEITFCLGMSESESGSDLAAVRTRAVPVEGGFRLTGRKIWTSHAHRSTHAYVLARTDASGKKHEGLTELVVDLSSDGVEVRPILDLAGEHHFNETVFEDVFVPAGHVIGKVGQGWSQVTEQLAFERGGMERVLSTYPLLAASTDPATGIEESPRALGALVARLHTLRAMAYGVATAMDAGEAPVQAAALLKYLGTAFENDVVDHVRDLVSSPPLTGSGPAALLSGGIVAAPGATLRGGATEVLLTIVGREELSPRLGGGAAGFGDRDLADLVAKVLGAQEEDASVWPTAVELGWHLIGVDEEAGGAGGTLADLAVVAAGLGRHGVSAPVVETAQAARLLADAGQAFDPEAPLTLWLGDGFTARQEGEGWLLSGSAAGVPWAGQAQTLLVAAATDGGEVLLRVDPTTLVVDGQHNLAGEARDTVTADAARAELVGDHEAVAAARRTARVLVVAATLGALEAAAAAAREHVLVREQFGKPLAAFQAVSHNVARMAAEVAAVRVALDQALGGQEHRVLAARVLASRASTAVARTAHQLLGAMGITQEHHLHRATLRLWSWRDELVSEREAARELGEAALAAGPDGLWDWVVHEKEELA